MTGVGRWVRVHRETERERVEWAETHVMSAAKHASKKSAILERRPESAPPSRLARAKRPLRRDSTAKKRAMMIKANMKRLMR